MLQCQQAPSFTLETGSVPFMVSAHARARDSAFSVAAMLLQTRAMVELLLCTGKYQVVVPAYQLACWLRAAFNMKLWREGDAVALLFRDGAWWGYSLGTAQTQHCAGRMWLSHSAVPARCWDKAGFVHLQTITQTYAQTGEVPNHPMWRWYKSKQESISSHLNGKILVLMHQ